VGLTLNEGIIVWFTGHSKAGKTTLSRLLFHELTQNQQKVIRLDSDTVPKSIIKPAAQNWEERQLLKNENLVFLSKLLCENGYIVLISSVGRYQHWRDHIRQQVPRYLEIYLKCPLEVRLQRDDTAKYENHSEYFDFYEEPENPDLVIETNLMRPEESMNAILELFRERGYLT
jgi:adenylylsulfate kinase